MQAEIPEALPLEQPEIGALLSNLLENAMEACEKQSVSPHIRLTALWEENGLQLEVRNSVDGEVVFENSFPKSTKAAGVTGTKSIAVLVNKYHGLLRFKQENEEFVVQILIPR